jgi:hypothetical protein
MKNIYEIFDEFEMASSKKEKLAVIEKNLSRTLIQVLELAFHPDYEWLINEMPTNIKFPTLCLEFLGVSYPQKLENCICLKRVMPQQKNYLMKRENSYLLQLIESLEPREAEVVIGILSKDLGVKGLNYKFVKEAFPQLLP